MIKLMMYMLAVSLWFMQTPLSEDKAVEYAMENNISLQKHSLKLDYINKEIWQGYLTYLPTASINHSFVKFSDENLNQMKAQLEGFKFLLSNAEYTDPEFSAIARGIADQIPNTAFKNVNRTDLTVNWTIFANGQALNWLSAKRTEEKIEEISLRDERKAVALKVRQAYYDLAIAQKSFDVNSNRLKTSKERYNQVLRLVEKGLRANSEKLRWALQVSQAEQALVVSESDVRVAEVNLNFELGAPIQNRYKVNLDGIKKGRFAQFTSDYVNTYDRSKISHVKKSELMLKQAESSKFYSYGKFLPSLNGRYVKNWQQHENMFQTPATWEASLNLTWNLFNGGKDVIDVQKAEISRYTAELDNKETLRQTELILAQTFVQLEQSRKQLYSSEKSLDLAKETYRMTKNRYDKGLTTNVEFLETENALFEAEMNQLVAYKMYLSAGFTLQNLLENN